MFAVIMGPAIGLAAGTAGLSASFLESEPIGILWQRRNYRDLRDGAFWGIVAGLIIAAPAGVLGWIGPRFHIPAEDVSKAVSAIASVPGSGPLAGVIAGIIVTMVVAVLSWANRQKVTRLHLGSAASPSAVLAGDRTYGIAVGAILGVVIGQSPGSRLAYWPEPGRGLWSAYWPLYWPG